MSKLADVVPPACAACYRQPLEDRFVDFEVAYDGPVLPEQEGGARYSIDDLVICETCLKNAGKIIGLGDVEAAVASSERFAAAAEKSEDRAVVAEDKLEVVKAAFEALGVEEPKLPAKPRAKKVQG